MQRSSSVDRLTRRGIIAAACSMLPLGVSALAAARVRRPLGLCDTTVTKYLRADYGGTLRKVAVLGYTHFGFRMAPYGRENEPTAQDKARLVRDAGMKIGVVRFPPMNRQYDTIISQARDIGATTIAMTVAPVFLQGKIGVATRSAFDAWLPTLAELGAKCRAVGLRLTYHTHWWDVMPLDGGESPVDIIAKAISPKDVGFEIDLAWTWYGGVAPLDILVRLGPRVTSLHLKDIDRSRGKTNFDHATTVGTGEMQYAALLPHIDRLTSAIGYVEVDAPDDGLEAAAQAARFIRDHRGRL